MHLGLTARRPVEAPLGPVPDAEALMRRHARSFSLAARLLPRPLQRPTAVLYTFYRTLDDLVDEPPAGWSRGRIAAELDVWESWLRADLPPDGPNLLCAEIGSVVRAHGVPRAALLEMIAGQRADLDHVGPPDFAALERYCQQVAGSVGEAMCHVLGASSDAAVGAARDLGVAMQLTNILRDVGEDRAAGRCYLPADELRRFGCTPEGLRVSDPATAALLAFQVRRARAYFGRGRAGVWLLPSGARPAILLAARLYERLLDCITRNDYDVFTRRAHPTRAEKALVGLVCAAELALGSVRSAGC